MAMSNMPCPVNHTHYGVLWRSNLSITGLPEVSLEPAFTLAARVRVVITCCFFLAAAASNTAVLFSILRKRRKSHIRVLILSLTVADLLVTALVMPLDAVWNVTVQWYAGGVLCKLLNFCKLFAMYAAALVLVVISLDRHSAILYPFSFTGASQRNRIMLCVAWILSILLAVPQLFLFRLRTIQSTNFTQCVTHGSFRERWQETTYNMFNFFSLFVMPLGVMVVCYVRILWEISKQMKDKKELARSKNELISKARLKTLKMTVVIVVSFMVCWAPYYLLGLWYWFRPEMIREMPEYIHHSLFLFGLLHTCSDPIIYGLYTPSFRGDLKAGLRRVGLVLGGRKQSNKHITGSDMNLKDCVSHDGHTDMASNGTTVQTVF